MLKQLKSKPTNQNITLEAVKQRFNHWRSSRDKKGKIPDGLWHDVLALDGRYKLGVIVKMLGINASQLYAARKRFAQDSQTDSNQYDIKKQNRRIKNTKLKFIELTNADANNSINIEIQRDNGTILKVNHCPMTTVAQLIQAFAG